MEEVWFMSHSTSDWIWQFQTVISISRCIHKWERFVLEVLQCTSRDRNRLLFNKTKLTKHVFFIPGPLRGLTSENDGVWDEPHLSAAAAVPAPPAPHTHTWTVHHPHQALITQNTSTDTHAQTRTRSQVHTGWKPPPGTRHVSHKEWQRTDGFLGASWEKNTEWRRESWWD